MSFFCQPVYAFDAYIEPGISTRTLYDDNFRLRSSGDSAFLQEASFDIDWHLVTPKHRFWVDTMWQSRNYEAQGDFDSENQYLTGGYEYSNPLWQSRTRVSFNRDSALTDEFDISGQFISNDVRREILSASSEVAWKPSFRDTLTFNVSASDKRYIEGEATGLRDQEFISGAATWQRSLSEKFAAYVTGSAYEFDIPQSALNIKSREFGGGGNWALSETLQVGAYGGRRQTDQEREVRFFIFSFDERESTSSNYFGATLEKKFANAEIGLSLDNRLVPGSDGELLTHRTLQTRFKWDFDPTHSASIVNRVSDSEETIAQGVSSNRKFGSLLGQYEIRPRRNLRVSLNLRYRWDDLESREDARESYSAWFQVSWIGERIGL